MNFDSINGMQAILGEWRGPATTLLHVIIILALSWLALRVSRKALARLHTHMQQDLDDLERIKRLNTLEQVSRYVVTVLIMLVTVMLVLSELGISIAPILAAAGVLGIAVGFGAQSLVKDYFTGLFLLLENQVRQGDVVRIADKSGLVEEMTLRYIRLRDFEGSVHYVPNGTIGTVTNRSRGYAYAVIDIGVAYREDIDEVYALMREVAAAMRADPELGATIEDDLEISGVDQVGRFRGGNPLPLQGQAAGAMGGATRLPLSPEAGLRRRRHRDSLSASDAVRRPGQGRQRPAAAPAAAGRRLLSRLARGQ
jgi:moderate conductance mechanosensitive channel